MAKVNGLVVSLDDVTEHYSWVREQCMSAQAQLEGLKKKGFDKGKSKKGFEKLKEKVLVMHSDLRKASSLRNRTVESIDSASEVWKIWIHAMSGIKYRD